MTKPREEQVSLAQTPFYHCYVRCVRRAFLCGDDYATGQNFDHRKQWIVSRLKFLSYVYAIDICAYAVMSNHYHVVLHVDKARAAEWTLQEVAERWMQLYNGSPLVNRWLRDAKTMDRASCEKVEEIIEQWRDRLMSLSWFMRGVNETVARMANEEEGVKGRFWEGRFKSQALLDETALLSCMAYVDLNPVRAGMADDLVTSDFTSIQQRLYDYSNNQPKKTHSTTLDHNLPAASDQSNGMSVKSKDQAQVKALLDKRIDGQYKLKTDLHFDNLPEAPLKPFDGSSHTSINMALPFTLEDYFALVDDTGRCLRDDKRGAISPTAARLINQFGINPDKWIQHIRCFGKTYCHCVGDVKNMRDFAEARQQRWVKGVRQAEHVMLAG